ncbi:hypothetical protein [Mycobacterium sp. 852013-50091_SCH5140682]|uniref:hypothetical protein n=1 Tax=Mycobacterium sp. 852013-50091_SCH5140682 TaxID=1834109 RepID=UPI0012EA3580|nr:hypothetical protein [Mycobacterium sp. 852013-50091_SCH5140682]
MPPVMDRKSSTERAERAWRLSLRGRTWQEVADAEGFRSRQSARKAVEKWLQKNPTDDIERLRRATGDSLTMVIHTLLDSLEKAHEAGRHRDVAELGKVVLDGLDKRAKLQGLHIAVPQVVDVNVQTMTEILTDTRARLLDAIDAEVVELPAERSEA